MSEPDSRVGDIVQDTFIINEVQLLLSEKRTSLSTLRTGIAIFAFPLSVLSVLIATSRQYEPKEVLPFLVPLAIINVVLIALGSYLIVHSIRRARHYDAVIMGRPASRQISDLQRLPLLNQRDSVTHWPKPNSIRAQSEDANRPLHAAQPALGRIVNLYVGIG